MTEATLFKKKQPSKYYETFFEWVKAKFKMLLVLGIYILVVLIFGLFVPEDVSCCGTNCDESFVMIVNNHTPMTLQEIRTIPPNFPATNELQYDVNIINMVTVNDRLDIINNVVDGHVYSFFCFVFILIFIQFVMNHKSAQIKIFGITLFDMTWIIIILLYFTKMFFYVNSFAGLKSMGCL